MRRTSVALVPVDVTAAIDIPQSMQLLVAHAADQIEEDLDIFRRDGPPRYFFPFPFPFPFPPFA